MIRLPEDTRIELLVIQATPFCNLDCDYCYLPDRSSTLRISEAVLRHAFERVMASRFVKDAFTVVWHAGEPLVVPVAFYERAFRLLEECNARGLRVSHSFQTNGTLLDDAWCRFLAREGVRVGVSVDGPAFLHDAHRRTRDRRGTHSRVMDGIRCLQRHGIDFHVITVLTRDSLDHADALFRFYVENGIRRVGFNVEEKEGAHGESSLEDEAAGTRLRRFLARFRDLVMSSSEPLEVREFAGVLGLVQRPGASLEANQENAPMRILSVDARGNFSTFSPELLGIRNERYGDFLLGNVLRDDLEAVTRTPRFERLHEAIALGVARCRDACAYFAVCGGGSPANKLFENASFASTETLHCRLSRQAVVDVVLEGLETSLGLG
jgi:uncharacterized protein